MGRFWLIVHQPSPIVLNFLTMHSLVCPFLFINTQYLRIPILSLHLSSNFMMTLQWEMLCQITSTWTVWDLEWVAVVFKSQFRRLISKRHVTFMTNWRQSAQLWCVNSSHIEHYENYFFFLVHACMCEKSLHFQPPLQCLEDTFPTLIAGGVLLRSLSMTERKKKEE